MNLLGYSVLTKDQYPAIKNGPLPADAAGSESFSNAFLFSLLAIVPWYLARQLGGAFWTTLFLAPFTAFPILIAFWTVASTISPRKNEKAKYPGRPVQDYLHFRSEKDRVKYYGKNRIPMETFHEMYFDEKVDFKGDCLEAMEYRHDWASFRFTLSLFRFFFTGMIPEVIMHTRSQGSSSVICLHLRTANLSFRRRASPRSL
jgi:sphingolipid C9-methyltransferase